MSKRRKPLVGFEHIASALPLPPALRVSESDANVVVGAGTAGRARDIDDLRRKAASCGAKSDDKLGMCCPKETNVNGPSEAMRQGVVGLLLSLDEAPDMVIE